MVDEIEQKSNGRITFTMFAGGALGPGPAQYDIVRTGKADICETTTQYSPGRFPLTDALTFPGAYETSENDVKMALAVMDRMLINDYTDTRLLTLYKTEEFYLYTANKKVREIEDMRGIKIRSGGGLNTPVLQALKATPVHMPPSDLYLSLQTGIVEGGAFGPSLIPSFKLQEVLKHVLKFRLGYLTNIMTMNLDTWNKLPDDLKQIVLTAARKAGHSQHILLVQDDPIVDNMLLGRGGSSYDMPSYEEGRWISALKPVVTKWVAGQEAKGRPVQELMNIIREETQRFNINFPY